MGHVRKAEQYERTADLLVQEMQKLGYSGGYTLCNSNEFFLPQSRPRIYYIFFEQGHGSPDKAFEKMWDFAKPPCALEDLLAPTPPQVVQMSPDQKKGRAGDKWKTYLAQHLAWYGESLTSTTFKAFLQPVQRFLTKAYCRLLFKICVGQDSYFGNLCI
jgi:site-specific DNA-cytosine methylase